MVTQAPPPSPSRTHTHTHTHTHTPSILLKNLDSPAIKVIDFGSACHENQTIYTYIQSRFYRSPEVLLGLPYTLSIDMWSLGCIAAELFLGLPIFPGSSEYNQMSRIVEMLGMPPKYMCEKGKNAKQFFHRPPVDPAAPFQFKSMEQYMKVGGHAGSVGGVGGGRSLACIAFGGWRGGSLIFGMPSPPYAATGSKRHGGPV